MVCLSVVSVCVLMQLVAMGTVPSSPLHDKYMALPLNNIRVILLDFLTPAERRILTTVSSTLYEYIGCSEQALFIVHH